jgi:hypothetical protein
VTAYQLIPVGAEGLEPDRAQRVEVLSYTELALQNEQLRTDLEAARVDVAGWSEMWLDEVNRRIGVQSRLNRSMRVLASLGRLSPRMAAAVEVARREVWGELP